MKVIVRPGLWLITGAAVLILVSLGTWQVQRLAWKNALIAMVEERLDQPPRRLDTLTSEAMVADRLEYAPLTASGGFPSARTAHVFGTWTGQPGFYVFQAFRLDDGSERLVLINRGFVPQDQRAEDYTLPDAEQMVGLARFYAAPKGLAAWFAPPDQRDDGVFYTRDPDKLASHLMPGEEDRFLPVALDSTLPTVLPRGGTTRIDFRNAHLGYALTWYGLAVGLLGVVGVLSVRRR